MKHRICLSLLVLGAITGCTLQSRQGEPRNAFLLDVKETSSTPVDWPVTTQIRVCRASTPLAGTALVYRLSRVRYERDSVNVFLVSPTEQVDALLDRRLGQRYDLEALSPTSDREWVIQPTLEQLWGDFTDPNQARAQVQIHFLITEISRRNRSRRVIMDARFRSAQKINQVPAAEELVTQLSVCLTDVLSQFETKASDRIKALDAAPGSSDP